MWQCAGRDRDYASTSYDSPHFARRQSGGSFVSRQSDHQDFSPARNHSKYDGYGDSSSSDYRQANSIPSEDESMDEGELRPISRSAALYSMASGGMVAAFWHSVGLQQLSPITYEHAVMQNYASLHTSCSCWRSMHNRLPKNELASLCLMVPAHMLGFWISFISCMPT